MSFTCHFPLNISLLKKDYLAEVIITEPNQSTMLHGATQKFGEFAHKKIAYNS
jgi:hypothetical protein